MQEQSELFQCIVVLRVQMMTIDDYLSHLMLVKPKSVLVNMCLDLPRATCWEGRTDARVPNELRLRHGRILVHCASCTTEV